MKLLGVLLGGLICSSFFNFNTHAQSTRADVDLAISFIRAGEVMPSREAQRAFGVETADEVRTYARIVRNASVNFADQEERDLLVKSLLPALDLIHTMNTRTIEEARLRSIDLEQLQNRRQQAFDLIGPISDQWSEEDLVGFESFSMNVNSNVFFNNIRACLVPAVNVASRAGGPLDPSNPANFVADLMVIDGFGGDVFVSVPGGDCRPDANDKKCETNDDPLGNDSCITSTSDYCRLVTRNGIKKCTQASDE